MKCKVLLFLLFIGSFTSVYSQRYSQIDNYVNSLPYPTTYNVDSVAALITKNAETERQKVRALYIWITKNINYDLQLLHLVETAPGKYHQPETVLEREGGICQGYANLFEAFCKSLGLQSLIVTGFVKDREGSLLTTGHAWNLVRTEGEWGLIDATWGAGFIDMEKRLFYKSANLDYFLTAPKRFLADHFPIDPLFQVTNQPVPFEVFKKSFRLKSKDVAGYENVMDSLNHFITLDATARLHATEARVLALHPTGVTSDFFKAEFTYLNAKEAVMDINSHPFYAGKNVTITVTHTTNAPKIEQTGVDETQKLIQYLESLRLEFVKAEELYKKVQGDPFFDKRATFSLANIARAKTYLVEHQTMLKKMLEKASGMQQPPSKNH